MCLKYCLSIFVLFLVSLVDSRILRNVTLFGDDIAPQYRYEIGGQQRMQYECTFTGSAIYLSSQACSACLPTEFNLDDGIWQDVVGTRWDMEGLDDVPHTLRIGLTQGSTFHLIYTTDLLFATFMLHAKTDSDEQGTNNRGTIIGISIGLGLTITALLLFYVYFRHRLQILGRYGYIFGIGTKPNVSSQPDIEVLNSPSELYFSRLPPELPPKAIMPTQKSSLPSSPQVMQYATLERDLPPTPPRFSRSSSLHDTLPRSSIGASTIRSPLSALMKDSKTLAAGSESTSIMQAIMPPVEDDGKNSMPLNTGVITQAFLTNLPSDDDDLSDSEMTSKSISIYSPISSKQLETSSYFWPRESTPCFSRPGSEALNMSPSSSLPLNPWPPLIIKPKSSPNSSHAKTLPSTKPFPSLRGDRTRKPHLSVIVETGSDLTGSGSEGRGTVRSRGSSSHSRGSRKRFSSHRYQELRDHPNSSTRTFRVRNMWLSKHPMGPRAPRSPASVTVSSGSDYSPMILTTEIESMFPRPPNQYMSDRSCESRQLPNSFHIRTPRRFPEQHSTSPFQNSPSLPPTDDADEKHIALHLYTMRPAVVQSHIRDPLSRETSVKQPEITAQSISSLVYNPIRPMPRPPGIPNTPLPPLPKPKSAQPLTYARHIRKPLPMIPTNSHEEVLPPSYSFRPGVPLPSVPTQLRRVPISQVGMVLQREKNSRDTGILKSEESFTVPRSGKKISYLTTSDPHLEPRKDSMSSLRLTPSTVTPSPRSFVYAQGKILNFSPAPVPASTLWS